MRLTARLLPHPLLSLSLAVVWLVLNASLAPNQIVLAILLGLALPILCREYWPERVPIAPGGFVTLAVLFLRVNWDIFVASLRVVALIVTHRSAEKQARFETVPLDCQSPLARVLLVGAITLTPGTLVADLDHANDLMLVHWLHEPDPDGAIRTIRTRYERPLKEIFG